MTRFVRKWRVVLGALGRLFHTVAYPTRPSQAAMIETRRISLSICALALVSGYLLYEEIERRSYLADVRFFDEVLNTMERFEGESDLGRVQKTNINQASMANSRVLDMILSHLEHIQPTKSPVTITSSISSCEVESYSVFTKEANIGGLTDRETIRLKLYKGWYTLIEFPISCFFSGEGPEYALVGNFSPEHEEVGAIYDHGEKAFPEHVRIPLYGSKSNVVANLFRLARGATGKYYDPKKYDEAVREILAITQRAPSLFGISLPTRILVFGLPPALLFLAFTLLHRARRVAPSGESTCILIDFQGPLEWCASLVWKSIMILAIVLIFLVSAIYDSPTAELQARVIYDNQSFSTEQFGLFDRALWIAGAKNAYASLTCILAFVIMQTGFFVLRRIRRTAYRMETDGERA